MKLSFLLLITGCFAPLRAQQTGLPVDTTRSYEIQEVVITERALPAEVRSSSPLQILSAKKIEKLNVLQISDAVKYFSGVTVKDYGGIGGLKTVSVRSLGASHTAVNYDGITLSDCQSGQIDIGRFTLENVDMLSLSNGQSDQIFQPARLFASASVLNITSLAPRFGAKPYSGRVVLKGGSFGLVNPAATLNLRLSPQFSTTLSTEWLSADGSYPYRLHYGEGASDSTSVESRKNTDVRNFRAEAALFGSFSERDELHLKSYYYNSERGLPGATIFYNTLNFSSQRVWDETFFTQGSYRRTLSRYAELKVNGKYHYGYLRYLDPTALNSAGKTENRYRQREYYLSACALFKVASNLSLSLATDGFINTLDADLNRFSYPKRYSLLSVVAAKYVNEYVLATGSLLSTEVREEVKSGKPADNHSRLTPYVSLSVRPFPEQNLRFRLFYKEIFRLPTFNDLYYAEVGNPDLKPENTQQYNAGVTYHTAIGRVIPLISFTADLYHNVVTDKIVAYPTKNIFTWTMLNYGRVEVDGVDLTGECSILLSPGFSLSLGGTHTYQKALNKTTKGDREYNHQIPYTPRVSGSAKSALATPWFDLSYSMIWSGHRYAVNQNYAENRLPGYSDHSLSVSRRFMFGAGELFCSAECLNLSNKNYAVVRYFPMPGRSWRFTAGWKF